MRNLLQIFDDPGIIELNTNLASALAHCPSWEAFGWSFRCVECHIANGVYQSGDGYGWHSHQEYQLEIPLAGAFEFEAAGGRKIRLRPGQAVIFPWKFAHRWRCLRAGPMLGISLELLPSTESIRQDGWLIDRMTLVSSFHLSSHAESFIRRAVDPAHTVFRSKAIACRLFLLLADILEKLFSNKKKSKGAVDDEAAGRRGREAVSRILEHLQQNLASTADLNEIAQVAGVSGRHLHRLFLKHVGESLHDHLLKMRLDHARRLLLDEGRKMLVKEISYQCGFNSLAYFSNSFRRAFGVSPSTLISQKAIFKSGFTVSAHEDPDEAAGPARKRASASAKKRARG